MDNNVSGKIGSTYLWIGTAMLTFLLVLCIGVFAPIGIATTGVGEILQHLGFRVAEVAVSQAGPEYYKQAKAIVQGAQEGIAKLPPDVDFAQKYGTGGTSGSVNQPATQATTTSPAKVTDTPKPTAPPKLPSSPESKRARDAWMGLDTNGKPAPVSIKEVRTLVTAALRSHPEGDVLAEKLDEMLKVCEIAETKFVVMDQKSAAGQVSAAEYELTKCNGLVFLAHNVYRWGKLMPFNDVTLPSGNEMLIDGLLLQVGDKLQGRPKVMLDTDIYDVSVIPEQTFAATLPIIKLKLTGSQLNAVIDKKTDWKKDWLSKPGGKSYFAKVAGGTGTIFTKGLFAKPPDPAAP